MGKFFMLLHGKSSHWWQPFSSFFWAHSLTGQILVNWKVFSDMQPSQTMFSGEVPKKEASPCLSFGSLFWCAARTEHMLQYIPHGDRYSSFAVIFYSPSLLWSQKNHNLYSVAVCLYGLRRSLCCRNSFRQKHVTLVYAAWRIYLEMLRVPENLNLWGSEDRQSRRKEILGLSTLRLWNTYSWKESPAWKKKQKGHWTLRRNFVVHVILVSECLLEQSHIT